MLEMIPNSSSSSNPPKQIVVSSIDYQTIVYTVPKGKIFKGRCTGTGGTIYINGVATIGYSADGEKSSEIVLVEGSTFAGSVTSNSLIGVEYDA